jgi:hypothetical protein
MILMVQESPVVFFPNFALQCDFSTLAKDTRCEDNPPKLPHFVDTGCICTRCEETEQMNESFNNLVNRFRLKPVRIKEESQK